MVHSTKLYLLNTEKLQNETIFYKYFHTVSQDRQRKILNYHFATERALSLGAGILVNRGLQEFGLTESNMHYSQNKNGKPYFSQHPDIHFNISHAGKYAVCAFAPNDIGCDIELVSDIDLNIAQKFFYHSEYEYIIEQKSLREKQQAFFRLWTLKESFMKITGHGMSLPLDSFHIYFDEDQIHVSQNVNSRSYFFHEYSCESNYKIACCSHSNCFEDPIITCYV